MATVTWIVFGPDYEESAKGFLDKASSRMDTRFICHERAEDVANSLATLGVPQLSPCILTFSHSVPSSREKSATQAEIRDWHRRFSKSIASHAPEGRGDFEVRWDADLSGGISVTYDWKAVPTTVLIECVKAIETAYAAIPKKPPKSWWQFWK